MATRSLSPSDDGLDGHQPETPPGVAGSHASKYTKEDSIMKDTGLRTFTVPRANGCAPFKFAVHTLTDGAVQVTRISPYDETEYHWALNSPFQPSVPLSAASLMKLLNRSSRSRSLTS